jgi:hypothetical protein
MIYDDIKNMIYLIGTTKFHEVISRQNI